MPVRHKIAQVRERGLHGAAVWKDPTRGRTLRGGRPALGLGRAGQEREDQEPCTAIARGARLTGHPSASPSGAAPSRTPPARPDGLLEFQVQPGHPVVVSCRCAWPDRCLRHGVRLDHAAAPKFRSWIRSGSRRRSSARIRSRSRWWYRYHSRCGRAGSPAGSWLSICSRTALDPSPPRSRHRVIRTSGPGPKCDQERRFRA